MIKQIFATSLSASNLLGIRIAPSSPVAGFTLLISPATLLFISLRTFTTQSMCSVCAIAQEIKKVRWAGVKSSVSLWSSESKSTNHDDKAVGVCIEERPPKTGHDSFIIAHLLFLPNAPSCKRDPLSREFALKST